MAGDRPTGNLPRIDRELLGSDREVEAVRTLLTDGRIVTLTGVGGVDKTSLSLGVAHQLVEGFADGVWFCELASVLDPNEVARPLSQPWACARNRFVARGAGDPYAVAAALPPGARQL